MNNSFGSLDRNNQCIKNNVTKTTFQNNNCDFLLTVPKYKLKDMILSNDTYEQLTTVIDAERCWDIVFDKWGLSSVLGDKRNLFIWISRYRKDYGCSRYS